MQALYPTSPAALTNTMKVRFSSLNVKAKSYSNLCDHHFCTYLFKIVQSFAFWVMKYFTICTIVPSITQFNFLQYKPSLCSIFYRSLHRFLGTILVFHCQRNMPQNLWNWLFQACFLICKISAWSLLILLDYRRNLHMVVEQQSY